MDHRSYMRIESRVPARSMHQKGAGQKVTGKMAHRWVYAEGSLHCKHLQSPNLRAATGQRVFISHRFCMHCRIRDKECKEVDKNSKDTDTLPDLQTERCQS